MSIPSLNFEEQGYRVCVFPKNKVIPFTKIDEEYLKKYVKNNLQKERLKFLDTHDCAACYKVRTTEEKQAHIESLFRKKVEEGKIFYV